MLTSLAVAGGVGASTYSGQSLSVLPGMPVIKMCPIVGAGIDLGDEMNARAAEVIFAQTSRMLLKPMLSETE